MEESLIFELIDKQYLYDRRKELENEDDDTAEWIKETREKLENALNKEQLELVDKYKFNIAFKESYIDFQVGIRILNYGIKIGMELQKAFDNLEE